MRRTPMTEDHRYQWQHRLLVRSGDVMYARCYLGGGGGGGGGVPIHHAVDLSVPKGTFLSVCAPFKTYKSSIMTKITELSIDAVVI